MRSRRTGRETCGYFLKYTADFGDNGYKVTASLTLQMVNDVTTMVATVLCFEWMSAVFTMAETNGGFALSFGQHVGHHLRVEGPACYADGENHHKET